MHSSSFASFAFVVAITALTGCAATSEDSDVEASGAAQTHACASYAEARATFDRAVAAAQAKLQSDYADAKAAFDADVEQAKRELADKLASMPPGQAGDVSGNVLSGAMLEYNEKIGPDGPLVAAYNARVADAQKHFYASTDAAKRDYDSMICH
jgi:hypothetical protein